MNHEQKLDQILSEVSDIKRGLYGDVKNKFPGLMQEHYELKADVLKLKENEKKRTWIVAGVTVTFPVLIVWAKQKFGL